MRGRIDAGGSVQASKAKGVRQDVAGCVADMLKLIEYPKPKGRSVLVAYKFTFARAT